MTRDGRGRRRPNLYVPTVVGVGDRVRSRQLETSVSEIGEESVRNRGSEDPFSSGDPGGSRR